jgi:hypothetical protein
MEWIAAEWPGHSMERIVRNDLASRNPEPPDGAEAYTDLLKLSKNFLYELSLLKKRLYSTPSLCDLPPYTIILFLIICKIG